MKGVLSGSGKTGEFQVINGQTWKNLGSKLHRKPTPSHMGSSSELTNSFLGVLASPMEKTAPRLGVGDLGSDGNCVCAKCHRRVRPTKNSR